MRRHALQRLAAEHLIRLLPVSTAAARVVSEQPGLVRLTLPANTYPGQTSRSRPSRPPRCSPPPSTRRTTRSKALLELTFERTDYLAFGSAQGVKIAKGTACAAAIPLHLAAAYFGAPAPAKK